MSDGPRFEVWGVPGMGEVQPGDDVAELLVDALRKTSDSSGSPVLLDGDIAVVTSKIVSKAEGRIVSGVDRDQAIDTEAVRTVSEWTTPRGRTRIVQTRHGFVMAAAGVDASNVKTGDVVLLPEDPDASARRIRDGLRERLGVRVGVIVTDTAGRVWRNGVVDMAIGAAGIRAVDDLRGRTDSYGNDLGVTVVAVADELASATELVRGKLSGVPIAVVRGLAHLVLPDDGGPDPGAAALIRPSTEDRFRLGTPEAMRQAVFTRRDVTSFTSERVDRSVVLRAIAAALTAPYPESPLDPADMGPIDAGEQDRAQAGDGVSGPPARFVIVESAPARAALAAAFGRARRAEILRSAGCVLVPCALPSTVPGGGQARREVIGARPATDLAVVLAVGAAVENLLITLAADGLGARWLFPESQVRRTQTPHPPDASGAAAARSTEISTLLELPDGWVPLGAIAVGHPADSGPDHFEHSANAFIVTR